MDKMAVNKFLKEQLGEYLVIEQDGVENIEVLESYIVENNKIILELESNRIVFNIKENLDIFRNKISFVSTNNNIVLSAF